MLLANILLKVADGGVVVVVMVGKCVCGLYLQVHSYNVLVDEFLPITQEKALLDVI